MTTRTQRFYQRQEAMNEDDRSEGCSSFDDVDGSNNADSDFSTSNNSRSVSVSFGTVTLREYERKLDQNVDVDLGLTLGWRFSEHEPVDIDSLTPERDYREAGSTSEGERAQILLANGYSKRQLRSALRRKHREMGDNESSPLSIPKSILSIPVRMMRSVSKKTKKLALSGFSDEQSFLY
mmetsp:Transcript_19873/g.35848  ORF Transcript_19873/g.35848 Transcript_19873/m.35848 type:complete len:180 (+) Transcript_19873:228-767(+)|eukprot:CAMPEP_0178768122 /NCGR_PEP_ID=MMETSP0744-20121128/20057_1 /TAXON_ID=913974 /ORGANISM="Nitzschia punctata, Strain CCMP561" /LENGTH=179 /DNA_ID=CAMNT_0020424145 /DNA_START=149 /DNA_END=688 /DNA_ORIENTATION=-